MIKIILVSGQLEMANIDIPADSRFFGEPLEVREMIVEMQSMIGHACRQHNQAENSNNRSIAAESTSIDMSGTRHMVIG